MDTMTQKQVSEEETKDNERFAELKDRQDLSDDEKKEVGDLKERHANRTQKRIDQLTWKARDAEEKFGNASKEVDDLRAEVERLKEAKTSEPDKIVDTVVEIAGKKYYTDESLTSMVKSGDITDSDAFKLQQQRNKAELKQEVLSEIGEERKKAEGMKTRADDQEKVLAKYPHFSNKHPDFNPEDPLYKEVQRLWDNGYSTNPKGLSKAISDARKILRISDKTPDLSNEFGVNSASAPDKIREKEVEFSADEEEAAVRLYTMGGATDNPRTGRPYTREEAIKKGKEAKQKRSESRRIT